MVFYVPLCKLTPVRPIPHDEEAYKWRHLIENYFSKIKEFRGVNTRYDKTEKVTRQPGISLLQSLRYVKCPQTLEW